MENDIKISNSKNMENDKARELIERAFKKAREKAERTKKMKNKAKLAKTKELIRVRETSEFLEKELIGLIKSIPFIKEIHPFYEAMLSCFLDTRQLRKALRQLSQSTKLLIKLKINAVNEIRSTNNSGRMLQARKEFYGRINSVMEKAKESIDVVTETEKVLRKLPKIDFSIPTIILAGYPNVGKSTLLSRITDATPLIANYPFTTKGINLGYFEFKYRRIQVIDTPGLLDRPLEKRNKIELQAVHALDFLADLILFIFDASNSAASDEQQLNLLKQVRESFKAKLAVIVNKIDLIEEKKLLEEINKINEVVPGIKIFLSSPKIEKEKLLNELTGFLKEKQMLEKAI